MTLVWLSGCNGVDVSTVADTLASREIKASDSYQSTMVGLWYHKCCKEQSQSCCIYNSLQFGKSLFLVA